MPLNKQTILLLAAALLAVGCTTTAIDPNEKSHWTTERFYKEAQNARMDGDYDEAIKLYEELEARFPYGRFAEQAQLDTAYVYYLKRNAPLTISSANRFIRLHPTHPQVDYAWYLKGLVVFASDNSWLGRFNRTADLGDRDPALARASLEAFRELIERFPQSQYASDAQNRMIELLDTLAIHEVRVARFYLNRGAWVASVNRAKFVIEHYPQTNSAEAALGVMIVAYTQMGLDDLAADAHRVLKQNFPNSAHLN